MTTVLVSWIGQTDLDACQGVEKAGDGPIGQALGKRSFDEVLLLSNYLDGKTKPYDAWVRSRTAAKLSIRHVDLNNNPTDYQAIHRGVTTVLDELVARFKKSGDKLDLVMHLSPGTPAMSATWLLLGKTKYPAELIQSSREQGVVTAFIPFDIVADFVDSVPAVTAAADAALENRSGGAPAEAAKFGDIVYTGRKMREVVERARKVAARSVPVLIGGDTGTGKELLARAIHQASPRANQPFIAVNCGAIPANLVESELFGQSKGAFTGAEKRLGRFRAAEGGTLFLDELGELPLEAQVKLLRAVQDRSVTPLGETQPIEVNVRLIAATHRNLAIEVQAGRFREDLFYRLAVAVLNLPPLRERREDLGDLVDALLKQANEEALRDEPRYVAKHLTAAAKRLLVNHSWPGNVRELQHTLMRATVWADHATISEADVRAALFQGATAAPLSRVVPDEIEPGFVLQAALNDLSRQYIERALQQTHGKKAEAHKLLGLGSHQVLTQRMKKLGIKLPP